MPNKITRAMQGGKRPATTPAQGKRGYTTATITIDRGLKARLDRLRSDVEEHLQQPLTRSAFMLTAWEMALTVAERIELNTVSSVEELRETMLAAVSAKTK